MRARQLRALATRFAVEQRRRRRRRCRCCCSCRPCRRCRRHCDHQLCCLDRANRRQRRARRAKRVAAQRIRRVDARDCCKLSAHCARESDVDCCRRWPTALRRAVDATALQSIANQRVVLRHDWRQAAAQRRATAHARATRRSPPTRAASTRRAPEVDAARAVALRSQRSLPAIHRRAMHVATR